MDDENNFVNGDHKYELQFDGRTLTMYQHSYLRYGLTRAGKSVLRLVEFLASFNKGQDAPLTPMACGFDNETHSQAGE